MTCVAGCSLLTSLDDLSAPSDGSPDAESNDAASRDSLADGLPGADVVVTDAGVDALPIGTVFSDDFDHWMTASGPWDSIVGTNPIADPSAFSLPNDAVFSGDSATPPPTDLKKTFAVGGSPSSITCTMQVSGDVTAAVAPGAQLVTLSTGIKTIRILFLAAAVQVEDIVADAAPELNSYALYPSLTSTWEPLSLEAFASGETLVTFVGQQFMFNQAPPFTITSATVELGSDSPINGTYTMKVDNLVCVTAP